MNYAAPMLPGMMEPNSYMASMGQVGSGTQQPQKCKGRKCMALLQEYVQPQELGPLPYGTEELSLEEYSTDHFRMFQFKVRQAPRKPGLEDIV